MQVRLDVGQDTEVDVQAESWWADPRGPGGTDLAVVIIPEDATAGRECQPARFGRVSDRAAVLRVEAFGFPRFKLRADPADADRRGAFRDFEQVTGHAPVAANRRQGTLAVYLDDSPPSPGIRRRGRGCREVLCGPWAASSRSWPSTTPARAPVG